MLLLIFLLLTICGLVMYYIRLNQDYWQKRNVPTIPPQWLFGNYKDILFTKRHLGHAFQDMYNAFPDADYVGYLKIRQPCVLLRDPQLVRAVLATNFSSFADNDFKVDKKVDPLFGNNPFVLKGEEWKQTRANFITAVTPSRLKSYLPAMLQVCETLVTHVETVCGDRARAEFETKELSNKYTTDIIANAVFGVQNNSFVNPDNTFVQITSKLFQSTFTDHLKVMAVLFFPQLANVLKLRLLTKESEAVMLGLMRQVLQHRLETGEIRNDFFQQMINYRKNDTQNVFTDEYIASHCFTFMTDGTETSSDVLCFTLFELAWHEDVQERLREEIEHKLKETGEMSMEAITQLEYLDMVLLESLRMHPPAMTMHRVCTKPYTLSSPDLEIQPGTPVSISVYGLHMDPRHYPEPQKFLPQRFSPELHAQRDKFTFLPFGEGPRICLGMKFALLQIKAALVSLLPRYRLLPSARSSYPPPLDPNIFLKRPLNGAWIYLQPIKV